MLLPKSTQPRRAFRRLARTRRAAAGTGRAAPGTVPRPLAVRIARRPAAALAVTHRATIVRRTAVALRNSIHRPGLLHLLARADRIALLEQLRECRARALHNRVLKLLREVRDRHVRVNGLQIPHELVRKATRGRLQRGDCIEHSREQDRLHHFVGGSLHVPGTRAVVDLPSARP